MNYSIIFFFILTSSVVGQNVNTKYGQKIIGGSSTNIIYFPFQVQVYVDDYFCGGSIISSRWVLTAAHCVQGAQKIYIRAGTTKFLSGGSIYTGSTWKYHPLFDNKTIDYDIALIQISKTFPIGTSTINTIKLAKSEPPTGKMLVVSGWGSYSYYDGPQPDNLKYLYQPTISRTTCDKYYYPITNRMICAFSKGSAACTGDSGGPLVDYSTKIQYGIVSFGDTCTTTAPDVYTNVANLRSWITSISGV